MARVKLRCIMGCPGLKSSYQEKGLLTQLIYIIVIKTNFKTGNSIKIFFSIKKAIDQFSFSFPKNMCAPSQKTLKLSHKGTSPLALSA